MDKYNLSIFDFLKDSRKEPSNHLKKPSAKNYKEFEAISKGDFLKFDNNLFKELNTDTAKSYIKYINNILDLQEYSASPTSDISIDRETIAQLTDKIAGLLKTDFDYIEEIILNKDDISNGGAQAYGIFSSLLRSLMLNELFINRRPHYNINIDNI